jgi:hypothetical protein
VILHTKHTTIHSTRRLSDSAAQVDDDQPLWWAKGGKLIGQSPSRIAWLRSLQVGLGRTVVSDIEAPNMLANLV